MSKSIFFISDLHFHIDPTDDDDEKLNRLKSLFQEVRRQSAILYIVGDLYDFWFEYQYVIPRAHLGILTEVQKLVESEIEVHYLAGNHDYWIDSFWKEDLGVRVHTDPIERNYNGKRFWISHGDGVVKADWGYRILKKILRHPVCIWLFRLIHPDLAFRLARLVSSTSRKYNEYDTARNRTLLEDVYHEYVTPQFRAGFDIVVTGHIHQPHIHTEEGQTFINLGDWLNHYSFGYFDGTSIQLNYWPTKAPVKHE